MVQTKDYITKITYNSDTRKGIHFYNVIKLTRRYFILMFYFLLLDNICIGYGIKIIFLR